MVGPHITSKTDYVAIASSLGFGVTSLFKVFEIIFHDELNAIFESLLQFFFLCYKRLNKKSEKKELQEVIISRSVFEVIWGWTNQPMDGPTDQRTNIVSHRGATLHLKRLSYPTLPITTTLSFWSSIYTHLLGVPVWDGAASAPEGANALCPNHLDILPIQRAALGGGRT